MSGLQRLSRFEQGDEVVVMKFGGTSVEDAAAIRRLISIVESRSAFQRVVVVSALAGVTDQLLEAGRSAASSHLGSALAMVRAIYVRHEQLADSLVEANANGAVDRVLRCEFQALEALLHDLEAARDLSLESQDRLLGFGECFSSHLVSNALCQSGTSAVHVDARDCIVTDERHGQASPLWDFINQRVPDALLPQLEAGCIPVLGGFIGSTGDGVPTTLGRGGSDFTAAIVAAALGASRVEIWTDVDGVMTADPKICSDARVIRKMGFDEAAELANFGAKVLHPATLAPAMKENIPVYVLNSRRPEGAGTEIATRPRTKNSVSAITAKRNVVAVEIESAAGINGVLDNVFAAFERNNCAVDVLALSPGRMSLLVESRAPLVKIAEQLRNSAHVRWENGRALICMVGENIRRRPEIASQVFAAVADIDARVLCQGTSDRTISFLVDESKVEECVQRLHAVFFPKIDPGRDWGGISAAYCQAG
jgi:aspartate kinase